MFRNSLRGESEHALSAVLPSLTNISILSLASNGTPLQDSSLLRGVARLRALKNLNLSFNPLMHSGFVALNEVLEKVYFIVYSASNVLLIQFYSVQTSNFWVYGALG